MRWRDMTHVQQTPFSWPQTLNHACMWHAWKCAKYAMNALCVHTVIATTCVRNPQNCQKNEHSSLNDHLHKKIFNSSYGFGECAQNPIFSVCQTKTKRQNMSNVWGSNWNICSTSDWVKTHGEVQRSLSVHPRCSRMARRRKDALQICNAGGTPHPAAVLCLSRSEWTHWRVEKPPTKSLRALFWTFGWCLLARIAIWTRRHELHNSCRPTLNSALHSCQVPNTPLISRSLLHNSEITECSLRFEDRETARLGNMRPMNKPSSLYESPGHCRSPDKMEPSKPHKLNCCNHFPLSTTSWITQGNPEVPPRS